MKGHRAQRRLLNDYLGSLIYRRNGGELRLESTGFGGGRIMVSQGSNGDIYTPNYFITDHLGSTRAIYDGSANIARSDFMPFGTRWSNGQAATSRYQFTGYGYAAGIWTYGFLYISRMYVRSNDDVEEVENI